MSKLFIEKILNETDRVTSFEWLGNGLCSISRQGADDFTAGFVWNRQVSFALVEPLAQLEPSFIASVPSRACWDGPAMKACEENSIGWGGIGTFRSACLSEDPTMCTEKTTVFARRIIRQHPNVLRLDYVNSLVYDVQTNGRTIRIALDNSYDLTGDSVRSAWDALQPFDALLKNNPNGRITSDARAVAQQLGVTIEDSSSVFQLLHGL